MPKDALKCIASWRRHLPDHEIVEWNEDNFDVNVCPYTAEAYRQGKYAFVSDYARFWVIYHQGGVYFDTDVEVIRPMEAILDAGPFMGIEKSFATNGQDPDAWIGVGSGLGFGAPPGMPFFKELLDYYASKSFDLNEGTVVYHTTRLLREHGLKNINEVQQVAGLTIYPDDYFCPMDSTTGLIHLTGRTYTIHHYSCSWMDHNTLSFRMHLLKNFLIKIFGPRLIMRITRK